MFHFQLHVLYIILFISDNPQTLRMKKIYLFTARDVRILRDQN